MKKIEKSTEILRIRGIRRVKIQQKTDSKRNNRQRKSISLMLNEIKNKIFHKYTGENRLQIESNKLNKIEKKVLNR